MAGEKQDNVRPLPGFYFALEMAGHTEATFKEASGLNIEALVIEYRHVNNPDFSTVKMPGIKKSCNVILRKGIFKADNKFWNWFDKINKNTIERRPITIKLLDEAGAPAKVWMLKDAWPTKITGIDMKFDGKEVPIETLEIAHGGLTIANY